MGILSLQETSRNVWQAKYRGNYGVYTIRIKIDGEKTIEFSCSCPSPYSPCKHIPMIEEAIKEYVAKNAKDEKDKISIEDLLKNLSKKEFYDFIVKQAKYNPELKKAILLEFANKSTNANNYSQIFKQTFESLYFDYEDIYDTDGVRIYEIDEWLDKAQEYIDCNFSKEATLVCKACIEEYASWYCEQDRDMVEYVYVDYERAFDMLAKSISMQGADNKGLFDYCKAEILKPKYEEARMCDDFNELIMKLSIATGSDDFIALQDKLLNDINDNSSYAAEKILKRKIDFYRDSARANMAWKIIEDNLQIKSFRKELAEKLIAENKLQEAKNLVDDFISQNKLERHDFSEWHELRLQIAQRENDIPAIREISLQFIHSYPKDKYYNIYKSTFSKDEWPEKVEELIEHYRKQVNERAFNRSIADVLQIEKYEERLMEYVKKYLSLETLVLYYKSFSSLFPKKTLAMFRKAMDAYAKDFLGREHYERIASLFKKMIAIEGGSEVVNDMINQYKVLYKGRRAMMEVIGRVK